MTITERVLLVGFAFVLGSVISGILALFPALIPDVPNARSSHKKITPRGGGVSFTLASLLALSYLMYEAVDFRPLLALWAGALLLSALGLLDDLYSLPARIRLILQILMVGVVVLLGAPDTILLPGLPPLTGYWVHGFQILWIVTCINFFNFMDGLDGLATTQALAGSALLALVLVLSLSSGSAHPELAGRLLTLTLVLSASLIGFLLWNFPPARLFMGDAGSYFLGFFFGFVGILGPLVTNGDSESSHGWFDFVAASLFLFPFLSDAAFTLVKRALRGDNVLEAHRDHLYQLYNRNGLSPLRVDLIYLGFSLLGTLPLLPGLLFPSLPEGTSLAALLLLIAAGALFYRREGSRLNGHRRQEGREEKRI